MTDYPLANTSWDEAEYRAIEKIVAAGTFTMGEQVAAYERAMADYLGCRYSVMVNSGSSANLLMVAALFYHNNNTLQRGDEVIVPAVSWGTTYFPLSQYGLHLKFVDIDPETLNYDVEKLGTAISDNTRVIMIVNLLGNPNDFDAIQELIGDQDIVILEDNCESLGATYKEQQTGTFGLMGSFSSFFSHHISTMEGGLISTNDEEIYHILLSLRCHGWTRHLPKNNLVTGVKNDDPFDESFKFVLPGYNVRPLELSGAIGLEQLKKLPDLIRVRRENASQFKSLMADFPIFRIQKDIGRSSWFGFSLVIDEDSDIVRDEVLKKLAAQNIEYRPIVGGNFTRNKVMQWLDYSIHGELHNAEHIHTHGFFIGNHHFPLDQQFEILEKALNCYKT